MPPIIKKGQSHTELPKELWDRTKQIEGCRRAISPKSQPSTSYTSQLGGQEQSKSPYLPSRVYSKGKGKKYIQSPYTLSSPR